MLAAYERHLIVSYLANAAARLHHRDRAASALAEWVIGGDDGVAFASRRLRARLDRANIDPEENLSSSDWRAFRRALRDEWRGGDAAETGPHGASAAAPGRNDRSQSNGRRYSGTAAALPDTADRRVDDRRGSSPIHPVRAACHPHTQGARSFLPCSAFLPAPSATGFPTALRW